MELNLEWQPPLELLDGSDQRLIYTCRREDLPDSPGIYVFARRHGSSYEALYVGKASSFRERVWTQFRNLPLMVHVRDAQNGGRYLLLGHFVSRQGQQIDKCLPILEHAFIRQFVDRGDNVSNIQGKKLKSHAITSSGSHAHYGMPKRIVVDAD